METSSLTAGDWALLHWLLIRIGSWTNARWDQHLLYEFGYERTHHLIDSLAAQGIDFNRTETYKDFIDRIRRS